MKSFRVKCACALAVCSLAALSACGSPVQTAATSAVTTTTVAVTTTATADATVAAETAEPAAGKTAAEPAAADYDTLGHGIDVVGCETKEIGFTKNTEGFEGSAVIDTFIADFETDGQTGTDEAKNLSGAVFGKAAGYDFDCDGKEEYIVSVYRKSDMYFVSCGLFYLDDGGRSFPLHDSAVEQLSVLDFDGFVIFSIQPDYTNGIYGGDTEYYAVRDGEAPAFAFSSHDKENTRYDAEKGYIYVAAGHMQGPYYAVVTPEREFLWITRDDLSADDLRECAKSDTYITERLKELGKTADDVKEAFTIGHLSYCVLINDDPENGRDHWYTLTENYSQVGIQSYVTDEYEHCGGYIHGVDLRKLNIVNR